MSENHKAIQLVGDVCEKKEPILSRADHKIIEPFKSLLLFSSPRNVLEMVETFLPFIQRVLCCSRDEATQVVLETMKYRTWGEEQIYLMTRIEELMSEIDLKEPKRSIPLKFAALLLWGGWDRSRQAASGSLDKGFYQRH